MTLNISSFLSERKLNQDKRVIIIEKLQLKPLTSSLSVRLHQNSVSSAENDLVLYHHLKRRIIYKGFMFDF